jgi:transcriptional regulator with GAF, ATPase, and Fis domain
MAISENGKSRHHSQTDKGPGDWETNDFIGVSREAKEVREQLDWLASDPMAQSVLLTGESGTGKDLAANILQSQSVCAIDKRIMVRLDGGTLYLENSLSAMFGHRKGAYTGAHDNRKGCFRQGEKGTVFVNEIGNIPLTIQPMMLGVVEDRVIKPLGSDVEVKVDAFMIFATNRDLEQMCAEERFMFDLLKRMQRFYLHLPSLRERKEDIPVLTDFLYRKICVKSKASLKPKIDRSVACVSADRT